MTRHVAKIARIGSSSTRTISFSGAKNFVL
jgi:hypothetical protein